MGLTFTDLRDGLSVAAFLIVVLIVAALAVRYARSSVRPVPVAELLIGLLALAVITALGMYEKVNKDAVTGIVGTIVGIVAGGAVRRGGSGPPDPPADEN
ncbi:hypothetical protein M1L60_31215 [Actinoplanes sp. TRM 88003]|uniref:Holin n=1 Tax=Paractinoplanes aksuensis TaxID=2939490 RepID=A0ABT1DW21_9ACTN|nr:hypothetical protein [Actinoplanes aksuensis]MCO8275058.1 hypothetical protein [Actinoplanes aksuensis]